MTKIFRDLTRKFVGLNIKKSVLTTKMRVFDHKNMHLTMKLEPVLTTKIVDNFAISIFIPRPSLVPRHQIFRARPAALSKNRVWTSSLVKLGRNYTSVVSCCRTNQIAQVK